MMAASVGGMHAVAPSNERIARLEAAHLQFGTQARVTACR
jgi:hypothetical protein